MESRCWAVTVSKGGGGHEDWQPNSSRRTHPSLFCRKLNCRAPRCPGPVATWPLETRKPWPSDCASCTRRSAPTRPTRIACLVNTRRTCHCNLCLRHKRLNLHEYAWCVIAPSECVSACRGAPTTWQLLRPACATTLGGSHPRRAQLRERKMLSLPRALP